MRSNHKHHDKPSAANSYVEEGEVLTNHCNPSEWNFPRLNIYTAFLMEIARAVLVKMAVEMCLYLYRDYSMKLKNFLPQKFFCVGSIDFLRNNCNIVLALHQNVDWIFVEHKA